MEGLLTLVRTIVMLALTNYTCGDQRQRERQNVILHESVQEMTVCKGQVVTVNIWPNVSSVEDLIGHPPSRPRGRNPRGQCAYVISGQDPRPFVSFTYSLSGLRFEIISPSAKFSDKFPWLLTFYNIDKLDSRYITCIVQNGSSKAWKTNFNFVVTDMKSPLFTSTRITMKTLLRNNVMTVECSMKPPVSSGQPPVHLALRGPYGELIENSKVPTLLSTLPDGYLAGRYSCGLEGQAMACIYPRLAGWQLNATIHIESILPRPTIEHPPFLIGRGDGHVNCTVILNQFAAADLGSGHPLTWDINGLPQKNPGSTRIWRFIPEGRVGVLQYVSELFLGTVGVIHIEQNITCTVRVGQKTAASSWIVQVVFPPLPPTIVGPDSVLIGDVTQFRCVTEGASLIAPTIVWDDNSGRHLQDMTHTSYVTYQEISQWKGSQYDFNRLWTPETLNNGRQLRLKRSTLLWYKRSSVFTRSGFQRSGNLPKKAYDATKITKKIRKGLKSGVPAPVQVFRSNINPRKPTGGDKKLKILPSRVQAETGATIPPWTFVAKSTVENSDISVRSPTPNVRKNGGRTEGKETQTRNEMRTVTRGSKHKEHKSTGKDIVFSAEQYSRAVKLEYVAHTDLTPRTKSPEGKRSKRASSGAKDSTEMPIVNTKDGGRPEITARVSQSKRYAFSGSEDNYDWLFGGANFEDEEKSKNKKRMQGKVMESVKEPGSVPTTWKQGNDDEVRSSDDDFSRKSAMSPLFTKHNISAGNDGQNKGRYSGANHKALRDGLENRHNASSTQSQGHGNSDGRKSGLEHEEGPDGSYPDKKHKATTMYRVVSVLDFLPSLKARETELKCMVQHLTLADKIVTIKKVFITDPPYEPVILGPNEMLQGENATWTCHSKGPSSSPPTVKWSDNESRDLTPLSWTSSTTFLGKDGRLWHNVTSKLTYSPAWHERDITLRCTATFSIISISVSGMINISVKDEPSSLSGKLRMADVTGSTHTQAATSSGDTTFAPRLHPDTSAGSGTQTPVNSVPNGDQGSNISLHSSPEEPSLAFSLSKTRRFLLESRSTSNTGDKGDLGDEHGMEVSVNTSARSRSSQEMNDLDDSGARSDTRIIPATKADELNRSSDNISDKRSLGPSDLKGPLETSHSRGKTRPTWKTREFPSDNTTSADNFTKTVGMGTDSNILSEAELQGSLKPFDDDKTIAKFNTSYRDKDTEGFSTTKSEISHSELVMNSNTREGKTSQTNRTESAEKKVYTAVNSTSDNTPTLNTLSNEKQGSRRHNAGSADNSLNTPNRISYKANILSDLTRASQTSKSEKNIYSDQGVEDYEEGSKAKNSRHQSGLNNRLNSSEATISGRSNLTSQENSLSPEHTDLENLMKKLHEMSISKYPVVKNARQHDRNDRANLSDDARSRRRLNLTSWTKSPQVIELHHHDYDVRNKTTTPLAERAKEHPGALKTNNVMDTSVNVSSGALHLTSWTNPGNILDSQLGVKDRKERNKTRNPFVQNKKQRQNKLKVEDGVHSSEIIRSGTQNRRSQPVTAGHSTSQPIKTRSRDVQLRRRDFNVNLVTPKRSASEVSFPPSGSMTQGNGKDDWPPQDHPPVTETNDDYDSSPDLEKPEIGQEKAAVEDDSANSGSDKMMFAAGFASVFIILVLVALVLLWYKTRRRHTDPTDGY